MIGSNNVIYVDFLATREIDAQHYFLKFAIDVCQIATSTSKVIDAVAWQNSNRTRYEIDISAGSESMNLVISLYSMQDLMDYTLFYVMSNDFCVNLYSYDELLEFFRDLVDGNAEIWV